MNNAPNNTPEKLRFDIIAVCVLLAAVVFLLDISVPLGIAVGVLYLLIIILSLQAGNPQVTRYIAVGCSLLLFADIFIKSPELVPLWVVLLNRVMILGVIWITAILGIRLEKAQRQLKKQESELQKVNQELEQAARHDSLTGVANRRLFDQDLEVECERASRGETPLSLLMIDVDHFKLYNDIKGHQAGDVCLVRVAKAITDKLRRPGDLVARYGGEEFAVILPVTTPDGAVELAEEIRQAVESLGIQHPDPQVNGPVTISIGAASLWPGAQRLEPTAVISAADTALYRAKHDGRNCVRVAETPVCLSN